MENDKKLIMINSYNKKLDELKKQCIEITNEKDFKELFRGVSVMFMKEAVLLYNKVLLKVPELKFSKSSEKISNLNILIDSLENDKKIFGIDCNDVILRGYVAYVYTKFRDYMINWDIEQMKTVDEKDIEKTIVNTASTENVLTETYEYMNIIPEVIIMLCNLREKDIYKLLYLLNNVNTIIDIYLIKKSTF